MFFFVWLCGSRAKKVFCSLVPIKFHFLFGFDCPISKMSHDSHTTCDRDSFFFCVLVSSEEKVLLFNVRFAFHYIWKNSLCMLFLAIEKKLWNDNAIIHIKERKNQIKKNSIQKSILLGGLFSKKCILFDFIFFFWIYFVIGFETTTKRNVYNLGYF